MRRPARLSAGAAQRIGSGTADRRFLLCSSASFALMAKRRGRHHRPPRTRRSLREDPAAEGLGEAGEWRSARRTGPARALPGHRSSRREAKARGTSRSAGDGILLDGNLRQALATFGERREETVARQIMDRAIDRNVIDESEHPQTAQIAVRRPHAGGSSERAALRQRRQHVRPARRMRRLRTGPRRSGAGRRAPRARSARSGPAGKRAGARRPCRRAEHRVRPSRGLPGNVLPRLRDGEARDPDLRPRRVPGASRATRRDGRIVRSRSRCARRSPR